MSQRAPGVFPTYKVVLLGEGAHNVTRNLALMPFAPSASPAPDNWLCGRTRGENFALVTIRDERVQRNAARDNTG